VKKKKKKKRRFTNIDSKEGTIKYDMLSISIYPSALFSFDGQP
jgi:hypothetical protein